MSENIFFSLQQKLCNANPVYTLLSSLKGLYDYKAILVTNVRISFLVSSSLVQPSDKKKVRKFWCRQKLCTRTLSLQK